MKPNSGHLGRVTDLGSRLVQRCSLLSGLCSDSGAGRVVVVCSRETCPEKKACELAWSLGLHSSCQLHCILDGFFVSPGFLIYFAAPAHHLAFFWGLAISVLGYARRPRTPSPATNSPPQPPNQGPAPSSASTTAFRQSLVCRLPLAWSSPFCFGSPPCARPSVTSSLPAAAVSLICPLYTLSVAQVGFQSRLLFCFRASIQHARPSTCFPISHPSGAFKPLIAFLHTARILTHSCQLSASRLARSISTSNILARDTKSSLKPPVKLRNNSQHRRRTQHHRACSGS